LRGLQTEINGDKIGNIPRVIVPAEAYDRFEHIKLQSYYNNCLLLSRLSTPIKIGIKNSCEWPFIFDMSKRYIVSIDIENFDGNQHRGLDLIAGYLRSTVASDPNSTVDVMHAVKTSWKVIIDNYGNMYELFGSQASGDINTSSSNSVRLLICCLAAILVSGIKSDITFMCQGDNACFDGDDMEELIKVVNNVTLTGQKTKIEGIIDRQLSANGVMVPAYLGAVGVKCKLTYSSLVNGKLCSESLTVPWRDPERFSPKIFAVDYYAGDRLLKKRIDEKTIAWLATYPFDLNLWTLAKLRGLTFKLGDLKLRQFHKSLGDEEKRRILGRPTAADIILGVPVWAEKSAGIVGFGMVITEEVNEGPFLRQDCQRDVFFSSYQRDNNFTGKVAWIGSTCGNCHLAMSRCKAEVILVPDMANIDNDFDSLYMCERSRKQAKRSKMIMFTCSFKTCKWLVENML